MGSEEGLSDVKIWAGMVVLALLLACTVGEAPPQSPGGGPAAEMEGEGEDPGRTPEPAEPEVGGSDAASERAAELLTRSQLAYEGGQTEEALRLARQVLAEYPGAPAGVTARWVAARAAFAAGRYGEARSLALEYAAERPESSLAEEARGLAELAADALESPSSVVVVGAVLPRTGSRVLVRYGDWILEGIELAVAEAERSRNRRIELVVADDEGGARVQDAVRELERQGAVAIVGPLMAEQIRTAAWARNNDRMVLVSPTSAEEPPASDAYSINASDARGAQALGQYAFELGLRQAAFLYPRIAEFERKAQAFAVEFEALGGEIRTLVPYDSGTTTFAAHMDRILTAVAPRPAVDSGYAMGEAAWDSLGQPVEQGLAEPGPERNDAGLDDARLDDPWFGQPPQEPFALFVAAPARDVRQIAPQLSFYGLDSAGVQVFGDEGWASAPVRRVVPARDLEGAIAASRFPPGRADASVDPDFVREYEARYRRSLENELPALGYDAAHLIMQALPNRLLTPEALSRRFHLLAGIRGATGLLSVRAQRVVRTPYLVVIRGGELQPAPFSWEYELPRPKPPLIPDTVSEDGGR